MATAFRRRAFGADRRLKSPHEFAAVLAAGRVQSIRAARPRVSMTAAWARSELPAVRFGFTVGKRNARRAVDRALVKRILREASRHAADDLEQRCAARGVKLDVAFRLKAPLADAATSTTQWRRTLRMEADSLLESLARQIDAIVPDA
jgi:ribonuclease P protein component